MGKRKVEVALRLRPQSTAERAAGDRVIARRVSASSLQLEDGDCFQCSVVMSAECGREELLQLCKHRLLTPVSEGKNATLIAYGRTGSGKTHSICELLEMVLACVREQRGSGAATETTVSACQVFARTAAAMDLAGKGTGIEMKNLGSFSTDIWPGAVKLGNGDDTLQGFDQTVRHITWTLRRHRKVSILNLEVPSDGRRTNFFHTCHRTGYVAFG